MQGLHEWLLANSPSSDARRQDRSVTVDVEEREAIRRRMQQDKWTLDRGAGYYATERVKKKLPYLVMTGKHAGRSRVQYVGVNPRTFWSHILRRDFFTTAVNAKLVSIIALLVVWYFSMLLGWSTIYYIIWRINNSCFIGFYGFRSAFMYATETQQTIGYGERATGECWAAAILVSVHSLQAVLLDSVILGIIFARISHPKQRGRSVLLSDCACIARRDGQLKLMFRIADIQMRSVIDPRVRAVMFTWGGGRRTAEGERIPVTAQDLAVTLDSTLLLPVTVEHTIDEASPLYGHTLQSLESVGAEIVVTFEASTELGDTFMSRQSYLPSEIHWGHTFVNVIKAARPGETQHKVDLSRFHDVEPQPGLCDEMTHPHRLSRKVVTGGGSGNVVPGRLLNENTLVLSEDAVVASRNGRAYLMFRLGDTFPGHVLDVQVTAHLYRWGATQTSEGELLPYDEQPLELEPTNLLLRYPVTLVHELDPARSPIAKWATQKGMRQDADAEVVVVARGVLYSRQEVATRMRVYSVLGDIKWGHAFLPVVLPGTATTAPGASSKLGAAVDWSHFHATTPISMPPPSALFSPSTAQSPRHTGTGLHPAPTAPTQASAFDVAAAAAAAAAAVAALHSSGAAGPSRPMPPHPPATGVPSRMARPHPSTASPLLRSPELSASYNSLASLHHEPLPPPAAPQQLAPPPPAIPAPESTTLSPASQQQQPQQAGPQPPGPPGGPMFRTASYRQLHRSPSAMLLVPGGGEMAAARPAGATAFAAPGAVPFSRRTDDDLTIGGNSDEWSSTPGNTTSLGSGDPLVQPAGTGQPRQQQGSSFTSNTAQPERRDNERTWHSTRSLFAALESIQQFNQQQQEGHHHHYHHTHSAPETLEQLSLGGQDEEDGMRRRTQPLPQLEQQQEPQPQRQSEPSVAQLGPDAV